MRKIEYLAKARKFAQRLPAKQRKQIGSKIEALRHDPKPWDSKPLKGRLSGCRRIDSGEYRIIYIIEDDATILITQIR